MEGCSKTSACAVPVLPDDPLVEILSRVPAKSICSFKCVSKAWRDLIADPHNRKKLRQPMHGLFVQTSEPCKDEHELDRNSFSFIDLTSVRSVPLDIDPCFPFLMDMTGIETFFLDSCNGLILFGQCHKPSHLLDGYIVCNPTTKQWLVVPACGSHEAIGYTYLAFDPAISSHFHLVQFQMPVEDEDIVLVHAYSSETRTWSQNQNDQQKEEQGQLEGWHHQFTLAVRDYHCAFVNGFLHLIVWDADKRYILAVDVQGKARRMIAIPGMVDGTRGYCIAYLAQSQGHLHCVTIEESVRHQHCLIMGSFDRKNYKLNISTWVLQDYDTQEWVLKNTISSLDVFREARFKHEFQVIDIHQDCNVVFFFDQLSCELIAYDMDRKEVSVIATFEDHKVRSGFARYIPYFSESPALMNKH